MQWKFGAEKRHNGGFILDPSYKTKIEQSTAQSNLSLLLKYFCVLSKPHRSTSQAMSSITRHQKGVEEKEKLLLALGIHLKHAVSSKKIILSLDKLLLPQHSFERDHLKT